MIRFRLNSNKLRRDLERESSKQLKVKADALANDLREATPVDTGHARDSWSVKPTKEGYEVTNDAEYIGALNAGHSNQAPSHFIEKVAIQHGTPSGPIATYTDEE